MHRRIFCAGGLLVSVAFVGSAHAQMTLPMKYFDDPSVNYGDGSTRVLVGARVFADDRAEFQVAPAGVLYVAPTRAQVTASDFHRYASANCSVVENELANERTVSSLMRFVTGEVKKFEADLALLNEESRKATRECTAAHREMRADREKTCAYSKEVRAAVLELGESLVPWSTQIAALSDTIAKRLDTLGAQPGGFAAATVSLFDQAELQKIKELNPSLRVTFVPLKDVTFSFTPSVEDVDSTIPRRTTLGFGLAGGAPPAQPGGSAAAVTSILSGGSVALGITLSRLGACDTRLLRSAGFFYRFDSFAMVKGSAMINTWAAYERLEESSTKGGFFTTKAVRKLYEDIKSGRVANVSVVGTGSADEAQMRERLEATILQDLVSQMADAKTLASPAANSLGLPTPSQSGATVMGDALQRCPHIYCQVGGFVLKGLASIFGGSTTRDEVRRQYDHKVERTFGFSTRLDDFGSATTLVTWATEPRP